MTQQFEHLESRIRPKLEALSTKVASIESPIICRVGFSKSGYFPLRAYVSFLRDNVGDEVVLTVDVTKCSDRYTVECEILRGEGEILTEMPQLNIEINASAIDAASALDGWVTKFESFLVESFEILHDAVHSL